jgi:hypothetical protein
MVASFRFDFHACHGAFVAGSGIWYHGFGLIGPNESPFRVKLSSQRASSKQQQRAGEIVLALLLLK